jgi:hypothetical protein
VKPLHIQYTCKVHDLEGMGHFLSVTGKLLKKKKAKITAMHLTYEDNYKLTGTAVNHIHIWWKKGE